MSWYIYLGLAVSLTITSHTKEPLYSDLSRAWGLCQTTSCSIAQISFADLLERALKGSGLRIGTRVDCVSLSDSCLPQDQIGLIDVIGWSGSPRAYLPTHFFRPPLYTPFLSPDTRHFVARHSSVAERRRSSSGKRWLSTRVTSYSARKARSLRCSFAWPLANVV